MNLPKSFFLTCLTVFLLNSVFSQNWQWDWGATTTLKNASSWNDIMDTDFRNNVYITTKYSDSVFFGDTSFHHNEYGYTGWVNWAIVKYSEKGELLNAMDITALPGEVIYDLDAASDSQGNLYVSTDFQSQVTIQDSTIYPAESSPEIGLDLTLAKFNSSFEMDWHHLVSSKSMDRVEKVVVSPDDYVYLLTYHLGSVGEVDSVNILGQDTAIMVGSMSSLAKVDSRGKLLWQHKISNVSVPRNLIIHGEHNSITLTGRTNKSLIYRQDTIEHPQPEETRPYILEIDSAGNFLSGAIPDWHMVFTDTERDASGNFFFSSVPWGELVINNDTITPDENSGLRLLAKLDTNYFPLWHQTIESLTGAAAPAFKLDTYQDTLFFGANIRGDFAVFDTVFNQISYPEAFIGKVAPDGSLETFLFSNTSGSFEPTHMTLDNCNNLLLSGQFHGSLYMEGDTLQSYALSIDDGVLIGTDRGESAFTLGPDTLVCDSILLEAPQDMAYYYWNDTLNEKNRITVKESGIYTLEYATTSGCWNRDTIFVEVQQGFSVELGNDTTLAPKDTLILAISDTLDSYLWSDGSTGDSLIIPGDIIGTNGIDVWVQATKGVCTSSDTIHIKSSLSVPELSEIGVKIYPNPADNKLYINTEKEIKKIVLFNTQGRQLIFNQYTHRPDNPAILDMSKFKSGVFFIKVEFKNTMGIGKVIKL